MFTINLDTTNDAFVGDPHREVVRILGRVKGQLVRGDVDGKCLDINGNTVGNWMLTPEDDDQSVCRWCEDDLHLVDDQWYDSRDERGCMASDDGVHVVAEPTEFIVEEHVTYQVTAATAEQAISRRGPHNVVSVVDVQAEEAPMQPSQEHDAGFKQCWCGVVHDGTVEQHDAEAHDKRRILDPDDSMYARRDPAGGLDEASAICSTCVRIFVPDEQFDCTGEPNLTCSDCGRWTRSTDTSDDSDKRLILTAIRDSSEIVGCNGEAGVPAPTATRELDQAIQAAHAMGVADSVIMEWLDKRVSPYDVGIKPARRMFAVLTDTTFDDSTVVCWDCMQAGKVADSMTRREVTGRDLRCGYCRWTSFDYTDNPEVYVVFDGMAYAISSSLAPSASYLLCAPMQVDGRPDVENWGPPSFECLSDETNAALAQVETALRGLLAALPKEVPAS